VEEIFVEKLRSIYQRARARDYYDIYRLLNQYSFEENQIREALQRKAGSQSVELRLGEGVPDEDIDDVEAYWDRALDRLVTEKPGFESVVDRIDRYLRTLSHQ
jgi:predicted nucleotidyltransferase component of viral defense system